MSTIKEIQELIIAKEYTKAEKLIIDLLARNPNDPAILFQQGFLEASRSNFEKAQSVFDHVFSIEPKHYMALFNSALIDEKNKENSKSLTKYNQVILIKPDYQPAIDAINRIKSKKNLQAGIGNNPSRPDLDDLGKLIYEWTPTSSSGIPYFEFTIFIYFLVFVMACIILGTFFTMTGNDFIDIYSISIVSLILLYLVIRYFRHRKNKYKVYENGLEIFISKPFFSKKLKLYYVKLDPETVQVRAPFPFTIFDDAYILILVGVSPLHPQMFEYAKLYTYVNFEETDKVCSYITRRIMEIREEKKKTMQ